MNRIALIIVSVVVMTTDVRAQDDAAVTVNESGGLDRVAIFTVPQPASFVRDTLTDYAEIPRVMPEVRISQVIERADDHTVVEQEAVAQFLIFSKRVYLVLDVEDGGATIRFKDRCGKSFEHYEGSWTFDERDGRTLMTYEMTAKPNRRARRTEVRHATNIPPRCLMSRAFHGRRLSMRADDRSLVH